MALKRTPDELLSVLDQANDRLNALEPGEWDLRSLLWEILTDVLDTHQLAVLRTADDQQEVLNIVTDYLVNNYGDD